MNNIIILQRVFRKKHQYQLIYLQEEKKGQVKVSAVDPVASMMAINNDALDNVAMQVREKLSRVIDNL